ncbi:hypothetical protein CHGG_10812 [Chaetomium globosum CBS 148.51]|uniref:Fructose-bisphosphate aldolase n=1 Tax=Chaetomium globosum (strain ATCC 6205 / CBS 148.51 / DSM 1962 / NBRC 6347 / NRRL 1970) TaxID=306901 RepID=Q2GMJ2_CHAGB|nr:uncharacterized protein CHGG_10812 [Chaetomium globosum CBS 148.51]EAQ82994.1 hypothetical protein CHGG_10812 [Chaetomium globosum CBS 148.51]
MGILEDLKLPVGVIYGDDVLKLFTYAREKGFAIPAVNVTSSSTVVATLEAARDAKAPIILQTSQGGAAYFAGKGVKNSAEKQEASVGGAIAAAHYIRAVAPLYGIPVVLHTDHCAKKLLPWLDGMLDEDEKLPLWPPHGYLLEQRLHTVTEEPVNENIDTCVSYLKRMAPMKQWLEMEIGITGGEEDGVDNTGVDNASLYTQPEDIWQINVHGVYAPGNVRLHPELLGKHQAYVSEKLGRLANRSSLLRVPRRFWLEQAGVPRCHWRKPDAPRTAMQIANNSKHGVIKVNVDTDLQWAYLTGIRDYVTKNIDYLKTQVGNPEGPNKPNKKKYDPRVWVREGEKTMSTRVAEALNDFNAAGSL